MKTSPVFHSIQCSVLSAEHFKSCQNMYCDFLCALEMGLKSLNRAPGGWNSGDASSDHPLSAFDMVTLEKKLYPPEPSTALQENKHQFGMKWWLVCLCFGNFTRLVGCEQGNCWEHQSVCFILFVTDMRLRAGSVQIGISVFSSQSRLLLTQRKLSRRSSLAFLLTYF